VAHGVNYLQDVPALVSDAHFAVEREPRDSRTSPPRKTRTCRYSTWSPATHQDRSPAGPRRRSFDSVYRSSPTPGSPLALLFSFQVRQVVVFAVVVRDRPPAGAAGSARGCSSGCPRSASACTAPSRDRNSCQSPPLSVLTWSWFSVNVASSGCWRARTGPPDRACPETPYGVVCLRVYLWPSHRRMIGTWYNARGDDGRFVLVRVAPRQGRGRR
jgi:hypothetical protein